MLEIIAIVILGQKISKLVKEKGLSPSKYVIIMVLLWIGLEFFGAFIGTIMIGPGMAAYPLGILGAIVGAIIGYQIAKNAEPKAKDSGDLLDANVV